MDRSCGMGRYMTCYMFLLLLLSLSVVRAEMGGVELELKLPLVAGRVLSLDVGVTKAAFLPLFLNEPGPSIELDSRAHRQARGVS